jgi:hypothetical protein
MTVALAADLRIRVAHEAGVRFCDEPPMVGGCLGAFEGSTPWRGPRMASQTGRSVGRHARDMNDELLVLHKVILPR